MSLYTERKQSIYKKLKRRIRTSDPVELALELKELYRDHRGFLAILRSKKQTRRIFT